MEDFRKKITVAFDFDPETGATWLRYIDPVFQSEKKIALNLLATEADFHDDTPEMSQDTFDAVIHRLFGDYS